jgi:hypothetical protein
MAPGATDWVTLKLFAFGCDGSPGNIFWMTFEMAPVALISDKWKIKWIFNVNLSLIIFSFIVVCVYLLIERRSSRINVEFMVVNTDFVHLTTVVLRMILATLYQVPAN